MDQFILTRNDSWQNPYIRLIQSRDVKSSRPSWPRGQICWPRPHSIWPRPRTMLASLTSLLQCNSQKVSVTWRLYGSFTHPQKVLHKGRLTVWNMPKYFEQMRYVFKHTLENSTIFPHHASITSDKQTTANWSAAVYAHCTAITYQVRSSTAISI